MIHSNRPNDIEFEESLGIANLKASTDPGPFRWHDVFGFLFGRRDSMLRLIASKNAIWVGAALVSTAALAREYDAVSFVHSPLDLLAPFGASIVLSIVFWAFFRITLGMAGFKIRQSAWDDYRVFLAGYWMTAPLAWLYAIPIEVMTDEITAVKFNLTMLTVVSIWRVVLFSYFLSVRYHVSVVATLPWVLIPCSIVAFLATLSRILSVVSIMGGVRMTRTQETVMEFQGGVFIVIFYGFIPLVVVALAAFYFTHRTEAAKWRPAILDRVADRSVWLVPVAALTCLIGMSCWFQPSRFRAAQVDQMLLNGQTKEAILRMQQLGQSKFPQTWDPPPKFHRTESQSPPLVEVMTVIKEAKPDQWVIDRLLVHADEILFRQHGWNQGVLDGGYLRSMLRYKKSVKLKTLKSEAELLAQMPCGDPEELKWRKRIVEIIDDSITKAIENEESELKQRESRDQEDEPDMSHLLD